MTSEKTVLIVEDEVLVAMDIGEELNERGWRVADVVGTVDAAWGTLNGTPPDLALLDVNLRGVQSFDLALHLRAHGTTVVFLSGNTADELPEGLQDCTFIQKPVNYDLLHDTLLSAIGPESDAATE